MEDIKDEIVDYLTRKKFVTLATSSPDGKPITHTLAYVNIGSDIYVSTSDQSRKVKNIQENPNVAYSVYNETEHLDELRAVQMEGVASIVTDNDKSEEILKLLRQKFTMMENMGLDPGSIIIKISPKICYFTDYIKSFGNRDKVEY